MPDPSWIDYCPESYLDNVVFLYFATTNYTAQSQSFTGDGRSLNKAKFFTAKVQTPPGNAVIRLYAETHATAFGVDSVPTGSILAESDPIVASSLTNGGLSTFTFSGANIYTPANGTHYCLVFYYPYGQTGVGEVGLYGAGNGSGTPVNVHSGNWAYQFSGWNQKNYDLIFYAISDQGIGGGLSGTLFRKFDGKRPEAGDLSSLGTSMRKFIGKRTDIGTFSASGLVGRKYTGKRPEAGIIACYPGSLTRKGAVYRLEVGNIISSGLVTRIFNAPRKLVGSLSSIVGTVVRIAFYKRIGIGTLDSEIGTIFRKFSGGRQESGSISFVGAIIRKFSGKRIALGNISFSGIVDAIKTSIGQFLRNVVGALSWSQGTIVRKFAGKRIELGTSIFSGTVIRKSIVYRIASGTFSFSGIIDAIKTSIGQFLRSVSGILVSTGIVIRKGALKRLEIGDLSSFGIVLRKFVGKRIEVGTLSMLGTVLRKWSIKRAIAGAISFSGIVRGLKGVIEYLRSLAGSLVWGSGTITRKFSGKRLETGVLSGIIGTTIRKFSGKREGIGSLSSMGTLIRKFMGKRFVLGSISFSGIVEGFKGVIQYLRSLAGSLSWSDGTVIRKSILKRMEIGSLLWTNGTVARKFTGKRIITGIFSSFGVVTRKFVGNRLISGTISFLGSIAYTFTITLTTYAETFMAVTKSSAFKAYSRFLSFIAKRGN